MSGAAAPAAATALADLWAAIAEDLYGLARLHDREPDAELLAALRNACFPDTLGFTLRSARGHQATALLRTALQLPVDGAGCGAVTDILAADYAAIYLHCGLQAPPYESPWLDDDGLVCQGAMIEVRACYRAAGLAAPDWRRRPDDHLSYELHFVAHLCEQAANGTDTLGAAAHFLDAHLLRWVDRFADRVVQRCETRFFAGLALLTAAYVTELRDVLADALGTPRPAPDATAPRTPPTRAGEGPRRPPCASAIRGR